MRTINISNELKSFHGTAEYNKHLLPGKSPILLIDWSNYVREVCNAYWLFDSVLIYQDHKALRDVNFQIWRLNILFHILPDS